MRIVSLIAVFLASPAAAFEGCVVDAMEAFEMRLSEAPDRRSVRNIELQDGRVVSDCGGIALLLCGADEACRDDSFGRIAALAGRFSDVPEPDDAMGRLPPWTHGLYPALWAAVQEGCGECDSEEAIGHFDAAARLWQLARVAGLVEEGAWR